MMISIKIFMFCEFCIKINWFILRNTNIPNINTKPYIELFGISGRSQFDEKWMSSSA